MNKDRTESVNIQGKPFELVGPRLETGDRAPDFRVVNVALKPKTLENLKGSIRIFSVIPSIDTPICASQAMRFNQESSQIPGVKCYTVSMDLPYALDRWCTLSRVDSFYMLSDYQEGSFGMAYGTLIKDLRLLTRAVFVVDEPGILRYVEYCDELYTHVDYSLALDSVKDLVGKAAL